MSQGAPTMTLVHSQDVAMASQAASGTHLMHVTVLGSVFTWADGSHFGSNALSSTNI